AFSWDAGDYALMEGPVASPDDEQALDLGLPLVLRDGLGDGAADAVSHVLGDLDSVVVLDEGRRALACTATDQIVLGRVDGVRSIREIIEAVPLPDEDVKLSLAFLLCAGVVQARPAPPSVEAAVDPQALEESVTPAPPELVLEVEEEAAVEPNPLEKAPALPEAALEEAVEEAVKALEAAEALDMETGETVAAPRRDAGDLQERLDDRVLRDVLGIGKGEMPVDLMDNALVADDVIRKATGMMAADPFGAIRLLEAIIPRIYVKELKREAQVLLARGYTRNPKWVRRGEEMLQGVIREDPSHMEAYLALGALYKDKGLKARAVTMFRKVLELRPDHNLAAAEVRSLSTPAPSKKLFGRT
ncbi:MAG TPA: tetratricopeptide repeat protein, partial [Thermoanaerobaculia bacterium]|nr:tetratricopeptide repeat protein [Thermoanaerobaculia bacterium]